MIDDDGSGTTGTIINAAWKSELYDQVDAALVAIAPVGPFTLADTSGAGLALSTSVGNYVVIGGRLVVLQAQVIYPVTSNGLAAKLGGLPVTAQGGHGGVFQGYGAVAFRGWIIAGTNAIELLQAVSGAALTNAALSGANITLHGFYLI
jgi:hypothetical protein